MRDDQDTAGRTVLPHGAIERALGADGSFAAEGFCGGISIVDEIWLQISLSEFRSDDLVGGEGSRTDDDVGIQEKLHVPAHEANLILHRGRQFVGGEIVGSDGADAGMVRRKRDTLKGSDALREYDAAGGVGVGLGVRSEGGIGEIRGSSTTGNEQGNGESEEDGRKVHQIEFSIWILTGGLRRRNNMIFPVAMVPQIIFGQIRTNYCPALNAVRWTRLPCHNLMDNEVRTKRSTQVL